MNPAMIDVEKMLEDVAEPMKARKKRPQSQSQNSESIVRKREKRTITIAEKRQAKCRGVPCSICNMKDTDPDPIQPQHNCLWAYYRQVKGETCTAIVLYITDGTTCWRCFRVWNVRYMGICTLTAYKTSLGKSHELYESHVTYGRWLTNRVEDWLNSGKDMDAMMLGSWPNPTQLERIQIHEIVWTTAKDEHLPADEYKDKYGDWKTNNRGDTPVVGPNNTALIKLKAANIWTREIRIIQQAKKK